jgi:small conductance mechanosensitive channel
MLDFFTNEINKSTILLQEKLLGWFEATVLILPNMIVAIIVFYLLHNLAKLVASGADLAFKKSLTNKALANFVTVFIKIFINLLGFILAINIMNLDKVVTSVLAGIGILGFALGFALQDMSANLIAGIALVANNEYPFKVGDFISTNGIEGEVLTIDLRSTVLRTIQGQYVIVPNKQIYENPISNFTTLGIRRIDLDVGISYGEDLERVEKITLDTVKNTPYLLTSIDEPIRFFFTEFADSAITYRLTVWVSFNNNAEHLRARHHIIKAIKKAYDTNGITIPFPIRTLDFGIKGGSQLKQQLISSSPN